MPSRAIDGYAPMGYGPCMLIIAVIAVVLGIAARIVAGSAVRSGRAPAWFGAAALVTAIAMPVFAAYGLWRVTSGYQRCATEGLACLAWEIQAAVTVVGLAGMVALAMLVSACVLKLRRVSGTRVACPRG